MSGSLQLIVWQFGEDEPDQAPKSCIFGTPELLEMLLLNLPIKDLLVNAQRVCKKWNSTIRDSPKLQQALFFSPLPGKSVRFLKHTASGIRFWAEHETNPNIYTVLQNPFQDHLALVWKPSLNTTEKKVRTINDANASWRRMLVCQPPIEAISYHSLDIHNETGLRFSDIEKLCSAIEDEALPKAPPAFPVAGSAQWMAVELASAVKRVMRPKPKWLQQ